MTRNLTGGRHAPRHLGCKRGVTVYDTITDQHHHRPAPRVHRAATLTIGSARCRRSLVAHGKLMEEHIVKILLIGATGAIGSRLFDEAGLPRPHVWGPAPAPRHPPEG